MPSVPVILEVTDPTGTYTDVLVPLALSLPPADPFIAAVLTGSFIPQDRHIAEDATGAAVVLEALATLKINGTNHHIGHIKSITRHQTAGGGYAVDLKIPSLLADLTERYAGSGASGHRIFAESTPDEARSEITFLEGESEADSPNPYYPTPSADTWMYGGGTGDTPATTTYEETVVGASALVFETDQHSFPPRGYFSVGGHWCYYDGLQRNPAKGNRFTAYNVVWDLWGTSGDDPVPADTAVNLCVPKPISTYETPVVEGQTSASPAVWEVLSPHWYTVREHDGRIDFHGDPTAAPFSYLAIRVTYRTIEPTDGSAYMLDDFVTAVLTYDGDGGADVDSGSIDVSGVDDICIPRARIEQTCSVLAAIQSACGDLELDQFNTADAIWFQYDPTDGKYYLSKLQQASTADVILNNVIDIVETLESTQLYGKAIVRYERPSPSLISPTRVWHPAVGEAVVDGGPNVSAMHYMLNDRAMAQGWQGDTEAGNNVRSYLMMDGNDSTGCGIGVATSAGGHGWIYPYYAWFAAEDLIEHIRIVLDIRSALYSDLIIEVVGIQSYTPGTPPTATGIITLSDKLRFVLDWTEGRQSRPVNRVAHGGRFGAMSYGTSANGRWRT